MNSHIAQNIKKVSFIIHPVYMWNACAYFGNNFLNGYTVQVIIEYRFGKFFQNVYFYYVS